MKARTFLVVVALHAACHSEERTVDRSQEPEIQYLDKQVESTVLEAQKYAAGLEGPEPVLRATAIQQTWDQYNSCAQSGRKSFQAAAVRACAESFQSDLNAVLKTLVDLYRSKHEKSFETLSAQVVALGEKGSSIGENLEEVQQTYKTCQDGALNKSFPENSGRLLRACEMTVEAGIKHIDFDIKTIDIDILDTL